MCSYDRKTALPLDDCPIIFWEKVNESDANFRRVIAIGRLIKMKEKLVATYFWHTFDRKIPIEDAEKAVNPSSTVCGSTWTFNRT